MKIKNINEEEEQGAGRQEAVDKGGVATIINSSLLFFMVFAAMFCIIIGFVGVASSTLLALLMQRHA